MRTGPSNHTDPPVRKPGVTYREDSGASATVEGKASVFTEKVLGKWKFLTVLQRHQTSFNCS